MGLIHSKSNHQGLIKKANCNEKYIDFDSFKGTHDSDNQAQLFLETKEFVENNPGSFEDLNKSNREMTPQAIDGVKFLMNVPVGESSQVSLNWIFNSSGQSKFFPGLTYVGNNAIRSNERSPVIRAEVDSDSSLGLNYAHYFNKKYLLKFTSYSKGMNVENIDTSLVYFGHSYTFSNSIVNPRLTEKSFLIVSQFLKRFNKNIDAGFEFATQLFGYKPKWFAPSFALRIRHGNSLDYLNEPNNYLPSVESMHKGVFLALLGPKLMHLSYSRTISPNFQFLCTFDHQEENRMGTDIASFGYCYIIPKLNLSIKTNFDTTCTIQTVVEKSYIEGDSGWSFFVSSAHNFPSNRTVAGVGLSIGR